MKLVLAGTTLLMLLASSNAHAGKAHREALKELGPKLTEATKSIKAACGAAPSFSIDKTFGEAPTDLVREVAQNVGYEVKAVVEHSTKFCNDKSSKALYVKGAKKIVIAVNNSGDDKLSTTYSKGTFVITTTRQSNSGGYKFEAILDEW